jgi:RNA polymerase sigma-70 factor (ECF subfamily)
MTSMRRRSSRVADPAAPGEPAEPGGAPADPAGFTDWVRPHLPAMARLAARLAPAADRDDVVQEALVRAWTKRRLYDAGRGTAAAWLLAITADQAGKARRRASSARGPVSVEPPPAGPDPDLARAVATLSARQRLAVDCFYYAGLTVAETAAVMGCAEGTVKSTLSDARARLRPLLEASP